MKAREIIRDSGFGPEDLAALDGILAEVWERYSASIEPSKHASARERIARIIVTLANGGYKAKPDELKSRAIETFEQGLESRSDFRDLDES